MKQRTNPSLLINIKTITKEKNYAKNHRRPGSELSKFT